MIQTLLSSGSVRFTSRATWFALISATLSCSSDKSHSIETCQDLRDKKKHRNRRNGRRLKNRARHMTFLKSGANARFLKSQETPKHSLRTQSRLLLPKQIQTPDASSPGYSNDFIYFRESTRALNDMIDSLLRFRKKCFCLSSVDCGHSFCNCLKIMKQNFVKLSL